MTDFNQYRFGFIGLGLIGGSIARAIRSYWPEAKITAYNPSRDSLEEAIADGVVSVGYSRDDFISGLSIPVSDKAETDPPARPVFDGAIFEDCDIVFLCAPVQKNAENLAAIRGHLRDSAILTDIGSTKRDILAHVEAADLGKWFVGGHPMTGSERTRYHNSKASLLENAYYIIAPSAEVPAEKTSILTELVRGMKAIPIEISCEFHDYAVAGISHLPHVVSAALVNLVKKSDSPSGVMHAIAAGGFRDITRISSSSPVMWEQICLTNGDNITKLLDDYIAELQAIRGEIRAGYEESQNSAAKSPDASHSQTDRVSRTPGSNGSAPESPVPERAAEKADRQIYDFFDSAKNYRDSFETPASGARNLLHVITVDIEDHPGMLAEVVSLLAVNAVSIKNIGIQHNREYQYGTLRVEFYSDADRKEAIEILTTRNYTVHAQD